MKPTLLLLFLAIGTVLIGQVSSDYTTNSLTCILLKHKYDDKDKWEFESAFKSVDLSTKYFNSPISMDLISLATKKEYTANIGDEIERFTPKSDKKGLSKWTSNITSGVSKGIAAGILGEKGLLQPIDSMGLGIAEKLMEFNVDAEILEGWAQQDKNGNFVVLNERSKLNMKASDMRTNTDAAKIKNARPLFDKLYVLVFDFGPIVRGSRYYEDYPSNAGIGAKDAEYVTEVNTYIYKLDIDNQMFEKIKGRFVNANFEDLNVPIKYVGRYLTLSHAGNVNDNKRDANGVLKPEYMAPAYESRLTKELAQTSYNEIIELAEMRIEDFKLRMQVSDGFPGKIKAEVGKKENLRVDQRYLIYRYVSDESGEIESDLVAAVRTGAKIPDNISSPTEADGSFKKTSFNQFYGGNVEPGMFMVQENDFGIAISPGFVARTGLNFNFRVEYNIAKWMRKAWKSSPLVGTMVYAEFFPARLTVGEKSELQVQAGLGISSKFYLNKYFNPEPFVGYYIGGEGGSTEGFTYLNLGFRSAIPINYKMFIVPEIAISTSGSVEQYNGIHAGVSFKYEM